MRTEIQDDVMSVFVPGNCSEVDGVARIKQSYSYEISPTLPKLTPRQKSALAGFVIAGSSLACTDEQARACLFGVLIVTGGAAVLAAGAANRRTDVQDLINKDPENLAANLVSCAKYLQKKGNSPEAMSAVVSGLKHAYRMDKKDSQYYDPNADVTLKHQIYQTFRELAEQKPKAVKWMKRTSVSIRKIGSKSITYELGDAQQIDPKQFREEAFVIGLRELAKMERDRNVPVEDFIVAVMKMTRDLDSLD